jgi:hypothetical protein
MNVVEVLLSDSPAIRAIQVAIVLVVLFDVYLIFYVVRDVLLRTQNLFVQILCIFLPVVFPVIGFLAYLLLRPSRTLKEREMEQLLHQLLEQKKHERSHQEKHAVKSQKHAMK